MSGYRCCPACNSNDSSMFFIFSNDVLKNKYNFTPEQIKYLTGNEGGTIDVVTCNSCGMVFIKNNYKFAEMAKDLKAPLAEPPDALGLKVELADMQPHRFLGVIQIVQLLLRLILGDKKDIKLLDFGGGYIGFHARIANVYGRSKCVVYDPGIEKKEVEGITYVNDILELKHYGPFDGIFCNMVLEHVLDPRAEIENIYSLLPKGGVAILGVPLMNYKMINYHKNNIIKNKGWASKVFTPIHVNYFSPYNFSKLIKEAGFQILPYQLNPLLNMPYNLKNPLKELGLRTACMLRYVCFRICLFFNIYSNFTSIIYSNIFVKKE